MAVALLASVQARASERPPDRRWSLAWRASLKASALVAQAPEEAASDPERNSMGSLWRLRLEPEARIGSRVIAAVSYEHRLRASSQGPAFAGMGVLTGNVPAPYRLRQLDWPVWESASDGSSWRHEVDRAYVAVSLSRVNLTVGRQAIGWGRGVLFGAVDLFAPFAPLEPDREWRRGVDAVRADVKLADRTSLDVVGAFAERLDASAFAARLRGYAGNVDLELLAGRRARDVFGGVTTSAAVGGLELHGELAIFRTPRALPGTDGRQVAVKAVAGGSYRMAVGSGVLVNAEYHYSGFGAKDAASIASVLADPDFRARSLRGDTQILQRHAVAAVASYEASPELTLALRWLHGPADGSGIIAPTATVTLGDKVSLLATAYVPYGPGPRGSSPGSEYGATRRSALLQVRIYE